MTDLTAHDLEQGFARHLRNRVKHAACGTVSDLSTVHALDMARDPRAIETCYCMVCGRRLPVAQFSWLADGEPVGS